jgi:hypothetical protein
LTRDKKRLIRNKLMTKLNLVNLLNPWLEIWYQDNFIETKGKKTKNTNLKKIIKKKQIPSGIASNQMSED